MKPYVSPELLEYLKFQFPDRCPSASTPERQVWMNSGAAHLVRHLEQLFEDQLSHSLKA